MTDKQKLIEVEKQINKLLDMPIEDIIKLHPVTQWASQVNQIISDDAPLLTCGDENK